MQNGNSTQLLFATVFVFERQSLFIIQFASASVSPTLKLHSTEAVPDRLTLYLADRVTQADAASPHLSESDAHAQSGKNNGLKGI